MTDLFSRQIENLNESNLTLVNDNSFKNELINNTVESILTLEQNSTLLYRPATITWNKITVRFPEKIGCLERIKRKKAYELETQKPLINRGIFYDN
jgi:hypothetical protein